MILLAGNVNPAAGGIERTLEHLTAELRAAGRDVGYLEVVPGSTPGGAAPLPVRVPWARGPLALLNPFRLRAAVGDAVRAAEREIEQIWARNAVVAGIVAETVPDLPLVFIPPGTLRAVAPWERRLREGGARDALRNAVWRLWFDPIAFRREGQALRDARAVVVFSENMRRMIAEDYGEEVARRVSVVPPGVDGERFRPSKEGAREGVVYLGRLDHRKGVDLLLEAVALLEGERLTVVGDGPVRADLEASAARLGVAGRVRFVGHDAGPERWLAAGRVLAVPSVMEPFGHVMLEGLAAGLPVVGFGRASGARTAVEDVVEDGANGVVVPERTPRALADGLERALRLAASPGVPERCRTDALERYRWDRFVARVLELGS